jgi:hypothetical protein
MLVRPAGRATATSLYCSDVLFHFPELALSLAPSYISLSPLSATLPFLPISLSLSRASTSGYTCYYLHSIPIPHHTVVFNIEDHYHHKFNMLFKALALAATIGGVMAQRPDNTSICDFYTTALLKNNTALNQKTLLTLVVNTAVIGNCTSRHPSST